MLSGFLEVGKSLSNRKWIGPSPQQERLATSLVQQHGVSQLTALLSVKRGVVSDDLASYLLPKLKSLMPDPYVLQDMQKGAERLITALTQKEKICIFADYDVDGTVSASMLLLWLKFFNITPNIYIPDRIKEGYGPNVSAMEAIAKKNTLIICVDCGTASHEAIKIAMEHGAEVLVLDHHIADEHLPEALAIINPKRKDDSSELDYLCAAGVIFIFLVAVSRILRERQISSPEIISFLDLVALATVADVVPLIKLNRAFVTQGLKILTHRNRPGLVALIDEAKIKSQPTTYHLGYLIAPRINAAGRLADAKFAIQLLTETSEQNAKKSFSGT
jgi:single-stranded-DNA-specific exonuclease